MQRCMSQVASGVDFDAEFDERFRDVIFVSNHGDMQRVFSFVVAPADIREICVFEGRKVLLQFVQKLFYV